MQVNIVNKSNNPCPEYASEGAAGMDIRANLETPMHLQPGERKLVPTGIYMEMSKGYECQVRPRSGLALKEGLTVLNTPGTIDSDYRGEVGVIIVNHSTEMAIIKHGDRVAQLVFAKCERVEIKQVQTLAETERGAGGFGHTGKQ